MFSQRMTSNVNFTFSVGDATQSDPQLVLSKTNRIGDTIYNI